MTIESYPQLILNVFIMEGLQLKKWYNIVSCVISALSVLYGFSDFIAVCAYGIKYPFPIVLWVILASFVDIFLRILSLAYLMTFMKAYVILIPFSFIIMMVCILWVKTKAKKASQIFGILLYSIVSFGCSCFEGSREEDKEQPDFGEDETLNQKFRIRPISKVLEQSTPIFFSFWHRR